MGRCARATTPGGAPLVAARASGNLLLVHGYFDHSGLFCKLIEYGLSLNCKCLDFDLPGRMACPLVKRPRSMILPITATLSPLCSRPRRCPGCRCGNGPEHRLRGAGRVCPSPRLALCSRGDAGPAGAPFMAPGAPGTFAGAPVCRRSVERSSRRIPLTGSSWRFYSRTLQSRRLPVRWSDRPAPLDCVASGRGYRRRTCPDCAGDADRTVDWRYNTAFCGIVSRQPGGRAAGCRPPVGQ